MIIFILFKSKLIIHIYKSAKKSEAFFVYFLAPFEIVLLSTMRSSSIPPLGLLIPSNLFKSGY